MLVSIIIPAYNAQATLAQCLEACADQDHPHTEIIVIDDGSTDDTPRIARTFSLHYIRQENRGPAAARNHGARVAQGEILAYTDADCIPDAHWVASLLEGFTGDTVAVGGTYAIANPSSALARMVHEEIILRHERLGPEVDFLGSFNVAYRKSAFHAAGGFDESFPYASAEDNDLAYRLADNGGALRFTPAARVAHHHPTRLWPYLRVQARHGYWRMKLYAKHPRRARHGDRYAGLLDLAAPPLSLLALLSIAVLVLHAFMQMPNGIAPIAALSATLYLLIQLPRPLRMAHRRKDPVLLLFAGVAALRDLARALGMIPGIWTFLLLKKGSP